jgi:hypothetical protein
MFFAALFSCSEKETTTTPTSPIQELQFEVIDSIILNELPVEGVVNIGLPDGTLIIKAAEGELERDYNLFYKLRLKTAQ